MFLSTKMAALATSAVVFAGGLFGVTAYDKTVALTIDGTTTSATGLATTVADVLRNSGVQVSPADEVIPALDTEVLDGAQVTVAHSRPLTMVVDTRISRVATTALTVDEALAEADPEGFPGARVSVSRDTPIGLGGITISVSTPKKITLAVDGKRRSVTSQAATVGELLSGLPTPADADDRVSSRPYTPLTEGMTVRLSKVAVSTKRVTEAIDFPVTVKKDSTLWAGENRIQKAGTKGKAKVTYLVYTTKDGKAKIELTRKVVSKPTAQVMIVGSRTTSSGVGINLARASSWDAIARCESGGNWSINTGNGYYGGLQFNLASWNGNGGRDFAAYPHHASRAEQITVANRYYAKAGFRPWSCRHVL